MARKREPIFPLFEEVRRYSAALTDEQFGKAIRYALAKYYGNEEQEEPDTLTLFAATILLDQAARYDRFREQQRENAMNPENGSQPSAANGSQVQPSDPPSPCPSPDNNICSKVIQLLNDLSGSSFRTTTQSTQKLIAARIRNGYSLQDMETVIRHQCGLWGKDANMSKYLRPETLFGNKFEGYLSDARRSEPKQEQGYVLAPLEDPFEVAMRGGGSNV